MAEQAQGEQIHKGRCHCEAVAFELIAPANLIAHECNCSICSMVGFLHVIVSASKFRLLKGEDNLVSYRFNTGVANHLFCGTCGVKPYYIPRSNPDGFSVNARCLDRTHIDNLTVQPFDGQNWEKNAAALAHLSSD